MRNLMTTLKHYAVSKRNAVIAIFGSLDADGSQEIETELWDSIYNYPGANIVVDMNNVHMLTSYGVGCLIEACGTVTDNGGRMSIARPQPSVYETLYLNGADLVIPIYETYQQALHAFGESDLASSAAV